MGKTVDLKKKANFSGVSFSLLLLIFVSLFAAMLTTAYTGLLETNVNSFGFPFAWKAIVSQRPVFQALSFVFDAAFWSALYLSVLLGIKNLIKRRLNGQYW